MLSNFHRINFGYYRLRCDECSIQRHKSVFTESHSNAPIIIEYNEDMEFDEMRLLLIKIHNYRISIEDPRTLTIVSTLRTF